MLVCVVLRRLVIVSVVSDWVVGCFCREYCMCLCCGVQVFLGVGRV